MKGIHTVTGIQPSQSVRFCHCHEHLMLSRGQSYEVNHSLWIEDFDKSREELEAFRNAGGTTVVEAQPVGCNRMAEALYRLSEETGVAVISSTGFHKMLFYPVSHWIFSAEEPWLQELFERELTEGLFTDGDSGLPERQIRSRAGIIKCALDVPGLEHQYRKLFAAAVKAREKTGAPFMVHIEPGSDPLELVSFLEASGTDLSKVYFCHMDRACPDIAVHKAVCEKGISVEYDTIGRYKYHSDEAEADLICEMIGSGYEDRILLSLDTTRDRLKAYNADGVGLCYILHTFLPLLRERGLGEEILKKFYCTNPGRILCY